MSSNRPIEKHIALRGSNIHYTRNGPASEIAICFLPGWGGSRWVWDYHAEYWAQNFRTLNIDFPGFGHSALPLGTRTVDQLAKDLCLILDEEDIKQCIIIGHSYGGLLALAIGQLRPQQVRAVIGADSFIHMDLYPQQAQEKIDEMLAYIRLDYQGALMELGSSYLTENCHPSIKSSVLREFRSSQPEDGIKILAMFLSYDMGSILDNYPGKVAAIVDGNKYAIEKERFIPAFSERIDLTVVEGSNHFLMLEEPEKFSELLTPLITKFSSL
ncbi:alpha/beta hydrolase [uncultured Pseudoteredinibacter sp.]|uniref:alpha/beta fold hydrolase n=1 Tax=uncultured Pseudoteredinibacter sp. TaxID=1641701 RepID=UPI00262D61B3|nr:alpha/beta hydrolase [uncultured Pseudoteredinibacter sp.]